jgi:hypothetical protein
MVGLHSLLTGLGVDEVDGHTKLLTFSLHLDLEPNLMAITAIQPIDLSTHLSLRSVLQVISSSITALSAATRLSRRAHPSTRT